jgi:hypothetical protein
MPVTWNWSCRNCACRLPGQLYCSCGTTATVSYSTGTTTQWIPLTYSTAGANVTLNLASPWTITVTSGSGYDYGSWANPQPTAEQLAEARARRAAEERAYEERCRARARVNERAEALLLSLLSDAQGRSYLELGWFEVRGSAGGLFRVSRRGQAGNVDELPPDGGDRIASYCIHPSGRFPDADAHAAQYLALVTNEPGFRAIANRTPHGPRLPVRIAA